MKTLDKIGEVGKGLATGVQVGALFCARVGAWVVRSPYTTINENANSILDAAKNASISRGFDNTNYKLAGVLTGAVATVISPIIVTGKIVNYLVDRF